MSGSTQRVMVVLHPFSKYVKGQVISDPVEMSAIKASEQGQFVVVTQLPQGPTSKSQTFRDE